MPEAQARDYETSPYADSADQRINTTCVDLQGASLAECIIEIEQSERSNYRAEQDLYAQRYMMVWAFFMTLASFLTAGVAAVGLVWIRATLVETSKAVKAADATVAVTREIGEAQVRAYITFESVDVLASAVEDKIEFTFLVKIRNSGQSPATRITASAQMAFGESDVFYFRDLASGETDSKKMVVSQNADHITFARGSDTHIICAVEIHVFYADVFIKEPKNAEKSFFMKILYLAEADVFHSMQQVGELEFSSRKGKD